LGASKDHINSPKVFGDGNHRKRTYRINYRNNLGIFCQNLHDFFKGIHHSTGGFVVHQGLPNRTPRSKVFHPADTGSMWVPHSTSNPSASFPHRLATSSHLSENAPHIQQRTFFWHTRLRTAPSITPQALEVERNTGSLV
jgi:hypothetical protein